MRVRKVAVERQRLLRVPTHAREGLGWRERGVRSEPEIAVREPSVSLSIICVQSQRPLEVRARLVHSIGATVQLKAAFEIRFVCLDVRRLAGARGDARKIAVRGTACPRMKRLPQRRRNRARYLVLHREDVSQLALEAVAP